MFISKSVSILTVFLYLLVSSFAHAENHTIDMLNKLGKEKMVYSEKVISIKVNDEVTWKSVDKGHNVEFIGMPKGVSKFKSKISYLCEDFEKKRERELRFSSNFQIFIYIEWTYTDSFHSFNQSKFGIE